MTRWQRLQKMSETQLAIWFYGFLCSDNCPIKELRTIAGIINWLEGEWVEDEYSI